MPWQLFLENVLCGVSDCHDVAMHDVAVTLPPPVAMWLLNDVVLQPLSSPETTYTLTWDWVIEPLILLRTFWERVTELGITSG